jgi:hypothetical protein
MRLTAVQKHQPTPLLISISTQKPLLCFKTPGLFIPHPITHLCSSQVNQFTQLARRVSHPPMHARSAPQKPPPASSRQAQKKDSSKGTTAAKKDMVNTRVELAALAFLAEAISTTL